MYCREMVREEKLKSWVDKERSHAAQEVGDVRGTGLGLTGITAAGTYLSARR